MKREVPSGVAGTAYSDDLSWSYFALQGRDRRPRAVREIDWEVNAQLKEEGDAEERLRMDVVGLAGELYARLMKRNNVTELDCPGCVAAMGEGARWESPTRIVITGRKVRTLVPGPAPQLELPL